MPQAVGYLRVSTERQVDSGLGLEAQREAVAAAAGRLGMPLGRVFTDAGLSGALEAHERPGLLEAVSSLRRGDTLIVAKRDRLGRDVIAVAMIERLVEKRRARIVSAAGEGTESDDPTSQLLRRVLDAFAAYERLLAGVRTKAALKALKARGARFSGKMPFGYRLDLDRVRLVPEPLEQAVLATIRDCRRAGFTLQAIAEELNRRGATTRTGSSWQYQNVQNILKRSAEVCQ